jgi:hypothetical protein
MLLISSFFLSLFGIIRLFSFLVLLQHMTAPPSTLIAWPVMFFASSDAR